MEAWLIPGYWSDETLELTTLMGHEVHDSDPYYVDRKGSTLSERPVFKTR